MSEPEVIGECSKGFVVSKPSGWHTVSGRGEPAVEAWIEKNYPDQIHIPECGLVHRLDQGTSGCLLVANSMESSERLQDGMRDGTIHKRYVAMVVGKVEGRGWFDRYFTSRYKRSKKITVSESGIKKHKGSCTYTVLDRTRNHSLLEVKVLGPGRRHQVRAGLACIGFPLVGDTLYGGEDADRLMLHASRLSNAEFTFEIPPPFGF